MERFGRHGGGEPNAFPTKTWGKPIGFEAAVQVQAGDKIFILPGGKLGRVFFC